MKVLRRSFLNYLDLLDASFWVRMFSIYMLLIFTWSIRFPTVFRKLYAEDGAVFLQETFDSAFPQEFFSSNVGYLITVMRIGGRFMSLFPLDLMPLGAALFSAVSMSFLGAVVYQCTSWMIETKFARATFTYLFCNLPLASFSAVGNIANTYMYWFMASVIVVFSRETHSFQRWTHSICNLLASLSNPLTILLLPFLVALRIVPDSISSKKTKFSLSDKYFFVGTTIQILYIIFFANRTRKPTFPNSLSESAYLILDRVFGTSLVPLWGHVSGSAVNPEFENTPFASGLWLRATISVVSILIILVLALMVFHQIKNTDVISWRFRWGLLATFSIGYTVGITLLFGAEPRYLLASSCLLLLFVLSFISYLPIKVGIIGLSYFFIVAITGLTPSAHLSEGKIWSKELALASNACQKPYLSQSERVRIETIPKGKDWGVMIPCKEILNNSLP